MAVAKKAEKTTGNRLADVIFRHKAGLAEDVALVTATLLICAFYQMENHRLNVSTARSMPDLSGLPALLSLPAGWLLTYGMQLFRAGFAALFVLTLLVLGFSNGVLKRWCFLPAVAALLGLPQLGLSLLGAARYDDGLLRFLSELSVMLGRWPFITLQRLLTRVFTVDLPAVAALTFGIFVLAFVFGYLLTPKAPVP